MILHTLHTENLGAHLGQEAILNKLKERYYWPQMGETIKDYIQSCDTCQRKGSQVHRESLNSIKVYQPFEQVGIDFKGPLPVIENNNRYIIVAIDYFTKWVEAKAVIDCKANTTANFIYENIICKHGAPQIILSDRG